MFEEEIKQHHAVQLMTTDRHRVKKLLLCCHLVFTADIAAGDEENEQIV